MPDEPCTHPETEAFQASWDRKWHDRCLVCGEVVLREGHDL